MKNKKLLIFLSIAVILCELLISPPYTRATTTIFKDGYESGQINPSPGAWTANSTSSGGTIAVNAGSARAGSFGCECSTNSSGGSSYCYDSFTGVSTAYSVTWFYFQTLMTTNTYLGITGGYSGTTTLWNVRIRYYNGVYNWSLYYHSSGASSFTETQASAGPVAGWNMVEEYFNRDATNGRDILYINGIAVVDSGAINNTGRGTMNRYYSGNLGPGSACAIDLYQDDVIVSDSYIDQTGPTPSRISASPTVAGQSCTFKTLWTDDVAVSGFIFGFNSSGSWVNDTWTSTSDWSNVTKTLNSTAGVVIQWKIWCNDTSNNWNNNSLQSLTTTALGWGRKFLGVPNSQISKIMGVPKTNIGKVNGVP